jgi:hypothetical protein
MNDILIIHAHFGEPMKLPSIQKTARETVETLQRFPLPLLSAFAGTIAALILMDHEGSPEPTILWGMLFGGILGIPLLIAATLFAERRAHSVLSGWIIKAAASLLVVGYACTVPMDLTNAPSIHGIRLLLLVLAAHMLVAFIPFASRNEVNGFWQYNKTLFLRALVAGLFAIVIYAGMAFALAALDNLFNMHILPKRYAELWVFVVGAFPTWFFLAGIPEKLDGLETHTDYPKGIKVFAQYVLLPIVMVYLAILYAYMAKILISWDWPQGWVSKLILGYSGVGILSLLLLHPLGNQPEHSWIHTMRRWFYISLVPLSVMFFLAVGRRVGEYAMTEGRYAAFAVGVWLVIAIAYFLILRRDNIKFVPASLCLGALLICCGPWGMFSVAERSQVSRLAGLLQKNGILVEGRIEKADKRLPGEDVREISAILSYLHEMHGYGAIAPWFGGKLLPDTTAGGIERKSPGTVAELMGVEYKLVTQEPGRMVFLAAARDSAVDIRGYANMVPARHHYFSAGGAQRPYKVGDVRVYAGDSLATLTVVELRGTTPGDSVKLDVCAALGAVLAANDSLASDRVSPEAMSISGVSGRLHVRVYISEARVEKTSAGIFVLNYSSDILYSIEGKE